jgi:hypothetical protein
MSLFQPRLIGCFLFIILLFFSGCLAELGLVGEGAALEATAIEGGLMEATALEGVADGTLFTASEEALITSEIETIWHQSLSTEARLTELENLRGVLKPGKTPQLAIVKESKVIPIADIIDKKTIQFLDGRGSITLRRNIYAVDAELLNVRKSATTNISNVIKKLQRGSLVLKLSKEGDWYRVLINKDGEVGYVSASYLVPFIVVAATQDSSTATVQDNTFGQGNINSTTTSAYRVETCTYCRGHGDMNCSTCHGHGYLSCNECHGKGYFNCNQCHGKGYSYCGDCLGRGYFSCNRCVGKGTLVCLLCAGRGTIRGRRGNSITCIACRGQGQFTCKKCNGNGTLSCAVCFGNGTLTCSLCYGNGTHSCTTCSGNGTQVCQICNGNGSLTCSYCNGKGTIKISNDPVVIPRDFKYPLPTRRRKF